MGNIVFNIAKGKIAQYVANAQAGTGGANLKIVPIETTGIESDATLQDYDNLSVLLAAANNEQTTMGRKTLSSVTSTVDDTGNQNVMDAADVTWTGATGNAVSALIIVYDPTGSSADTALIPLTKHDWTLTPDGSDATATIANFATAS